MVGAVRLASGSFFKKNCFGTRRMRLSVYCKRPAGRGTRRSIQQNIQSNFRRKMVGAAGFPYGHFTDVKCLRAGPRGFCLLHYALKQKHRSGLLIPTRHPAVGVASKPIFPKQKPPCGGFYFVKIGAAGFEPTTSRSRTVRATNCATPRKNGIY